MVGNECYRGGTVDETTMADGTTTVVSRVSVSSTTVTPCSPSRVLTYTEAKEKQKKERRKKNDPVPPWLKPKMGRDL